MIEIITKYLQKIGVIESPSRETNLLQPLRRHRFKTLTEKIKSQSHELPFFVHPFYSLNMFWPYDAIEHFARQRINDRQEVIDFIDHHSPQRYDLASDRKKLKKYLPRLFATLKRIHYPVIGIAEAKGYWPITLEVLRTQGFDGNILYYETEKMSPRPIEKSYMSVLQQLILLHTQSIIFGGMYGRYPHSDEKSLQIPSYPGMRAYLAETLLNLIDLKNIEDSEDFEPFFSQTEGHCVSYFVHGIVGAMRKEMKARKLIEPPIKKFIASPIVSPANTKKD